MNIIPENQLKEFLKIERTFLEIAKKFKIPFDLNPYLTSRIGRLIENFSIFKTHEGKYYWPELVGTHIGIFRATQSTFGFVELKESTNEDKKIFIPGKYNACALDNDEVRINVYVDRLKKDSFYGVVTKILQRNTKFLIGKVLKNGKFWNFEPVNFKGRFFFRWSSTTNLVEGDFLKVKIVDYQQQILKISVIQKIGNENEPFLNIKIPIIESEVSVDFDKNVLSEAAKIDQKIGKIDQNRIDLRSELVVTIDGEDTKDFDDAISVQKNKNGDFVLKVHIADVANYVKQNSAIDLEAQKRGTSIYLPQLVIPMLPEELSNGICSLKPNVDRFTVTMEALINSKGENLAVKVYPSVINSHRRLTYDEVNDFFAGKNIFSNENLEKMLINARELDEILANFKKNQGYIDFAIDEVKIILDSEGYTEALKIKKHGISENLIENFMVRANENVAELLAKNGISFLYRIHNKPDPEKVLFFNKILKSLGINQSLKLNSSSKDFAEIVEKIKAENNDNFLKYLILRTMQKAIYSTKNEGHFGLAAKFYTHFTSPIRRYPDLLLHRIIEHFLFKKNDNIDFFDQVLAKNSYTTSELEQRAFNLERKICSLKKAEYAQKFVGKKYKAQIISIIKVGFFVEIEGVFDAMVNTKTLPDWKDDSYVLSDDGFCIYNKKNSFRLGQFVDILIENVNIWDGKISALLVENF
ncbi:ribonuclease R [Mycoplasma sp. 'Moose RK']|uniref:ribonuclease R n=1 Tax=Mycoplasma sp. 'Moose RK' TaxID=2780095 RepID=UPI0018C26992|nr:ribonuclease R [Mycoplasma sp. 'Moose RK']MBG0730501.1 ribonuclease R [Mycoplasma sp. 'Moose RK']